MNFQAPSDWVEEQLAKADISNVLTIPYSYVGDTDILEYAYPLDSGVDVFAHLTLEDGTFNPLSVEPAGKEDSKVWVDSSNLSFVLFPGGCACVGTGLTFDLNALGVIQLPAVVDGKEILIDHRLGLQVRTPSGRAFKVRMVVANSPGTIDQKYQNELKVLVWNTSVEETLVIKHGDKIAQIVAELVPHVNYEYQKSLTLDVKSDMDRGTKGFGSSPTTLGERYGAEV